MADKKVAKFRECDRRYLERELKDALSSLERFLDPNNSRCGVDPEVRKAAQLYLSSWVAGPMRRLLVWAHGEEIEPNYQTMDDIARRRKILESLLDLE